MGTLRLEEMRAPAPIIDADCIEDIYIRGKIVETYCPDCCLHGILLTDFCKHCEAGRNGEDVYIPTRQWECIHSDYNDEDE